jgi:hypothetical protein
VYAFTSDKTGGTLPRDLAPWYSEGTQAVPVCSGSAVHEIVQRQGYYLVQSNGGAPAHFGAS